MKQITYTSTISQDVWTEVSEIAAKLKLSKKEIIEKSVKEYLFKMKKKEFEEGFRRLANDSEMVEMAEMGMEDYLNQLKDIE
jgi:hypothetical protein